MLIRRIYRDFTLILKEQNMILKISKQKPNVNLPLNSVYFISTYLHNKTEKRCSINKILRNNDVHSSGYKSPTKIIQDGHLAPLSSLCHLPRFYTFELGYIIYQIHICIQLDSKTWMTRSISSEAFEKRKKKIIQ